MRSGLTPERWRRLEPLLDQLLEAPPTERASLAAALAGDDDELRRELVALAGGADAPGPLDRSLTDELARLEQEPEAGEEPPGERVGPWRVLREIGRGGMGVVCLAERADGVFEQRVAVKLLRRDSAGREVAARFRRERQILAQLQHPHIARLLDGGSATDGRPYLAMEHVEGQVITAWCDARQLPVEQRLGLFVDVCEAVEYAHRHLVVHRDLKPSNVLVTQAGEVKLLDFGIAKLLVEEPGDGATRAELRLMTPRYAAPEQVRGEPVSTATDTYALGLLLHELLAGRGPYRLSRDSPAALEAAVLEQEPEAPSRLLTSLDLDERRTLAAARGLTPERFARRLRGDLDAIVLTALQKEPERRYATAAQLAEDVRRHLAGRPVSARPPSLRYRAGRFLRRHRLGATAAGLVAASLIAGLAGTLWQARARERAARRAEAVKEYLLEIFEISAPSESRGRTVTARELLDRGAASVETKLAGQPDLRAELVGVIGELYRSLGLLDRAEPLLAEALTATRSLHGDASREHAEALARWGNLLYDRGRYAEARRTHERALELRRQLLGPRHPTVAQSLGDLALALRELGDNAGAERRHREALAIDRDGDPEAMARDLVNLGTLVDLRGQPREGEALLRQALAIRQARLGQDHPATLVAQHELAILLSRSGRYDEGERLLRAVLERERRIYGSEHFEVAETLATLSLLLRRKGDERQALQVALEDLAIRRRVLGPGHPRLAVTLNNLALVAYQAGDFETAERHLKEALDIWRKSFGEEHEDVASALNNLGMVLRALGQPQRGEPLVRRALELRRRLVGEDSEDVAQSLRNLGLLLTDRREHVEAQACLERSLELSRRVYPEGHPRLAEVMLALGDLRLAQGRAAEALPLLEQAARIRRDKLGAAHAATAAAEAAQGRALAALGRAGEARILLAAALPRLQGRPFYRQEAARCARALRAATAVRR